MTTQNTSPNARFFLLIGAQATGPFDTVQILEKLKTGEINWETQAAPVGGKTWSQLLKIPDFDHAPTKPVTPVSTVSNPILKPSAPHLALPIEITQKQGDPSFSGQAEGFKKVITQTQLKSGSFVSNLISEIKNRLIPELRKIVSMTIAQTYRFINIAKNRLAAKPSLAKSALEEPLFPEKLADNLRIVVGYCFALLAIWVSFKFAGLTFGNSKIIPKIEQEIVLSDSTSIPSILPSEDSKEQVENKETQSEEPQLKEKQSPPIASKWPTPEEIVSEMATLCLLQMDKPVVYKFEVVQTLGPNAFEITIHFPSGGSAQAYLATVSTQYNSTGTSYLPLVPDGKKTFKLNNGFEKTILAFREATTSTGAASLSVRDAKLQEQEFWRELTSLRRLLVCSVLHFGNPPVPAKALPGKRIQDDGRNRDEFFGLLGANSWKEQLKDSPRSWFIIEITRAYSDIETANQTKKSPADYAAGIFYVGLLRKLAKWGEKIANPVSGPPPMHIAVSSYIESRLKSDRLISVESVNTIIEVFEDNGGSAKDQDYGGNTLMHVIASDSNIFNRNIFNRPMSPENLENYNKVLVLLKQNGLSANTENKNGFTSLFLFLKTHLTQSNPMRIPGSNPIDTKRSPNSAFQAKRFGIIIGNFVKAGGDINGLDRGGNSLLHYASDYRDLEIMKVLVSMGIDVNQKNKKGDTPLTLFCKRGEKANNMLTIKGVEFLLENKADKQIPDSSGKLPVSYLPEDLRYLLQDN